MGKMLPPAKPGITRERALKILKHWGVDLAKEKVVLIGIRGYYRDTMGAPGKNDVGIYDDAFVWIDETDFATFNGNTDPSRYKRNVATLRSIKPGEKPWRYKKGNHGSRVYGPYPAFRQADKVTVLRYVDGVAWKADTGFFGINKHKGENNSTSSLGCQTTPPAQWDADREYGYMLLKRHGRERDFAYLLVDIEAVELAEKSAQAGANVRLIKVDQAVGLGARYVSAKGLNLIKSFEGFELNAYKDTGGVWTIGYGTIKYPDGKKVKQGDVITKEEAENCLRNEIASNEKCVVDYVDVALTQNQFDALVSFAYNCGNGAFRSSTLLKKLNRKDYAGAADELLRWNKDNGKVISGLTNRRKRERELFLT